MLNQITIQSANGVRLPQEIQVRIGGANEKLRETRLNLASC